MEREEVHEAGLRVYTSLNLEMQQAAQQAVRDGLAAYERRHGWKGNLLNIIANGDSLATYHHVDWDSNIVPGSYLHALVTEVDPQAATVKIRQLPSPPGTGGDQVDAPQFAATVLDPRRFGVRESHRAEWPRQPRVAGAGIGSAGRAAGAG